MSFEHDTTHTPLEDAALLALVEQGDDTALSQLYDRHSRLVYTVALRVTGHSSDAEDILQEVFVQLWQQPQRFVPTRGTLTVWLGVIARNRSIDLIRGRRLAQTIDELDELAVSTSENLNAILDDHSQMEKVRTLIFTLPPEQRKLLELAFFAGKTHNEIALHTGYPLGTIKTRIRSALASLRNKLQNSPGPIPPAMPRENNLSRRLKKSHKNLDVS